MIEHRSAASAPDGADRVAVALEVRDGFRNERGLCEHDDTRVRAHRRSGVPLIFRPGESGLIRDRSGRDPYRGIAGGSGRCGEGMGALGRGPAGLLEGNVAGAEEG